MLDCIIDLTHIGELWSIGDRSFSEDPSFLLGVVELELVLQELKVSLSCLRLVEGDPDNMDCSSMEVE